MFSQVVLDGAFGGFGSEIVKQIKAKKLLLISRNGSRNVDDTVEITNRTTTTLKVDFLSQDAVRILSQIPSFFNSDIPLIYISNAGRLQIAKTSSLREEEVETSTRINCTIPFMITSILLKVWKEKLTITNISSLNALIPTPSMRYLMVLN